MRLTSAIAIYFLIFCFSAFVLLPFGVRTSAEAGEDEVPGQAQSAPHRFDLKRHLGRAAILAVVLFAIFYANYQWGWITTEQFDYFNPPAANDQLIH